MYSNKLVCQILYYIDLNINAKIDIDTISNIFFYNRYYIMKLFKKELNISIIDYINTVRVYNSTKEIKDNNNSLTMASINNGFYSLEYFSEIFKKIVGVSPSIYKKSLNYINNLSEKELNLIRKNSISIQTLIDKKDNYLLNTKPETIKVKKLSIFK